MAFVAAFFCCDCHMGKRQKPIHDDTANKPAIHKPIHAGVSAGVCTVISGGSDDDRCFSVCGYARERLRVGVVCASLCNNMLALVGFLFLFFLFFLLCLFFSFFFGGLLCRISSNKPRFLCKTHNLPHVLPLRCLRCLRIQQQKYLSQQHLQRRSFAGCLFGSF